MPFCVCVCVVCICGLCVWCVYVVCVCGCISVCVSVCVCVWGGVCVLCVCVCVCLYHGHQHVFPGGCCVQRTRGSANGKIIQPQLGTLGGCLTEKFFLRFWPHKLAATAAKRKQNVDRKYPLFPRSVNCCCIAYLQKYCNWRQGKALGCAEMVWTQSASMDLSSFFHENFQR